MSSPLYNLKKTHRAPLLRVTSSPTAFNPISRDLAIDTFPNIVQNGTDLTSPRSTLDDDELLDEVTTQIAKSRKQSRGMVDPFKNTLHVLTPVPKGSRSRGPHQNSDHSPDRNSSRCSDEKSIISGDKTPSRSRSRKSQYSPESDAPRAAKTTNNADTPSDKELMALMMSRLSQLEQKVQKKNLEIAQKDKSIQILKDKLDIVEKARGSDDSPSHLRDLETKCLLQQQQICEMESFLTDYGMTWIGDQSDDERDTYIHSDTLSLAATSPRLWKPDEAVAQAFAIDHDLIARNVRELNILAGEGQSKIQHTPDGARLKVQEAIPLTVYANGIILYSGPFRSISESSTQTFIRDLHDRFFPSELQSRYPDGVPISLVDKRGVNFHDTRDALFRGSGQTLGSDPNKANQLPDHRVSSIRPLKQETQVPGPKVSLERFLNKIPKNVIKDGKVVPVRDEISENMTGYKKQEQSSREKVSSAVSDASTGLATLRIRTPTGCTSITIKLKVDSTIGDLKKCIDKKRSKTSLPYTLVLPYPHTVLDNDSLTLEQCGISCNTVLHMTSKKLPRRN